MQGRGDTENRNYTGFESEEIFDDLASSTQQGNIDVSITSRAIMPQKQPSEDELPRHQQQQQQNNEPT